MWRNTGYPVRIFMLDARALLPVLCFVVKWSWVTFYIAAGGISFFALISIFGLTVPAVFRLLRRFLAGPRRPCVPSWQRRRLV
jgi:intracellular multiplication protein IcmT